MRQLWLTNLKMRHQPIIIQSCNKEIGWDNIQKRKITGQNMIETKIMTMYQPVDKYLHFLSFVRMFVTIIQYIMQGESLESIDIVKKHILKYARPSDLLAMQALGVSLILQMASICIISADYDLIGWSLQVLTFVRFFVQFHDMAHFSFFASINLNKICGNILGIVLHIPFQVWRQGHNNHHKDFGNLDVPDISQSILFTKKEYEQMHFIKRAGIRFFREPVVFLLFTSQFSWFVGLIFAIAYQCGIYSKAFAQKLFSLLFYFYLLPLAGVPVLKICIAVYAAVMIGTIMFHLQHSVNIPYRKRTQDWDISRAAIEGSTFLEVPLLLKPFFNGIEYHHIHHCNTNVPTYQLQQCHETFQALEGKKWVEDYHVNRVGHYKAILSLCNVMYDEETKLLVPFSYKLW